jgi:hypothetical protein
MRLASLTLLAACGRDTGESVGVAGTPRGAGADARTPIGTGGSESGDGTTAQTDAQTDDDSFVQALANDELIYGGQNVHARWWSGLLPDYIAAQGESEDWIWSLVMLNVDGATNCGVGTITLTSKAMSSLSFVSDAFVDVEASQCSLELIRAAPDVGDRLEGTFSGRLGAVGGRPDKLVTGGSFRVRRVEDAP